MEADLVSLFCIVVIALLAPIFSALVPNRMLPETVLLLIAGMLVGPHVLAIAQPDAAITLFSDLGLGFLFLLAGYEINPQELTGKQGRHGLF
ncbi:MAG: cation:proton antiporter, partial [Bacteroidales bacterium]